MEHIRVVMVIAVVGACGGNDAACEQAKRKALDAVAAQASVARSQQELRADAAAKIAPERLDAARVRFAQLVERAERELACARLAKASAPDLVPVQAALGELVAASRDVTHDVPIEITKAVEPTATFYETSQGTFSGPNAEVPKLCQALRERIASLQTELAPLWTTARAERVAEHAKLTAERERERERQDRMAAWSRDVEAGKVAAVPAGEDAPVEVAAYVKSCRQH